MKKYSKNREIRGHIKKWLEEQDKKKCPFSGLWTIKNECEICIDIFPDLTDSHGFANGCPCVILPFDYVIRKAKEYIKCIQKNGHS